MDVAEVNERFAVTLVDELVRQGVRHAVVCPGSRSAPLAMAIARDPRLRLFVHVDERSAAFFALGLGRATGSPAVLVCTSGTAVAEFHPAVVEAGQARVPLVVLTADRPPELVGVGANQAIDQGRIFGSATRWFEAPGPPREGGAAEWRRLAARAVSEATGSPPGPVHLNLAFREPLVPPPGGPATPEPRAAAATRVWRAPARPSEAATARVTELLRGAERPVVVAGELHEGAVLRGAVARLGLPVLAEPSSGLRAEDLPYDAMLRDAAWADAHRPDLVLRVGAVPTSKPLNAWLSASAAPTVLVDESGWRDPDRLATEVVRAGAGELLEAVTPSPRPAWQAAWRAAGLAARRALDGALDSAPLAEPQAVRALARALPVTGMLFTGSSMPVRDVDTFWPAAGPGQRFFGNRGASGIDGMVSTALGIAAAGGGPAVALLGDLGFFHDLNGLWAVRRHRVECSFVVLDNDGGGIFSFLPQAAHEDVFEEVFGTPLGFDLPAAAALHGLACRVVDAPGDLDSGMSWAVAEPGRALFVRFSRAAGVAAHRACWPAVSAALAGQGAE